jgi:hypothetical protein
MVDIPQDSSTFDQASSRSVRVWWGIDIALMALRGIEGDELVDAAHVKAARRGRFETGAWLTTTD